MNVLFLIQNYSTIDGSSKALYEFIKNNDCIKSYKILCRKILSKQSDINIEEVRSKSDMIFSLDFKFDVVHYFKTLGYELFNWILSISPNTPIITTICQRPSKIGMMLSPNEIEYSNLLIFIDKTAYNDHLIRFIPTSRKLHIYFGRDNENIKITREILNNQPYKNKNEVTFGRGSSLNKCPKDIIDVFDKISLPNKRFVIAGINDNSWLHEITKGRPDVSIVSPLEYEKWLELCNTFDIFLYQLPENSHSSIDGTLGDAMMLEKPCIYFGPDAAKERFVNENDGIICNNKEEIIYWATKLGSDETLRSQIGERARVSTINNFSFDMTIQKYNEAYSKILSDFSIETIKVPLRYKINFFVKQARQIIRYYMSGTIVEHVFSVYK